MPHQRSGVASAHGDPHSAARSPQAGVHEPTDVRQGEIILRSTRRRAIFIAGLVGIALLPFVLWLLAR